MRHNVRLNAITAEFNMTGRCRTCNKAIRRVQVFKATTLRELLNEVDAHNENNPFLCKAHGKTERRRTCTTSGSPPTTP